MEKSKKLIDQYTNQHQWLTNLNLILVQIEKQLDDCGDSLVECSKSFLEAIAKNVIFKLSPSENLKRINLLDLGKLFKKARDVLVEHSAIETVMPMSDIENFFSALNQWIRFLGEIRNNVGEISHGKVLPKPYSINIQLAHVIHDITDGFSYILISMLVKIDLAYMKNYCYEDHGEFNEYLDDQYNLPSSLSYSKALYDQDYDAYSDELGNYLDAQGIEVF